MKLKTIGAMTLSLTALLVCSAPAAGFDFFGNDIGTGLVTTTNQCAALCDSNPSCLAWTWVRPGLKHPTSAVCFLKNPIPAPSLNSVCKTNTDCLSGIKRSDGWCGESPLRNAPNSQSVLGQGAVLACSTGQSCGPKVTVVSERCWIFFTCRSKIQSVDYFCQ